MNRTSKKRILGVAAAVALAVGTYVTTDGFAHGPGNWGWGGHPGFAGHHMMGGPYGYTGHPGFGPGMMGGGPMGFGTLSTDTAAVEGYLADLKTRLGITATQETAWRGYATAVTEQNRTHTDTFNTMHGITTQTPQDRSRTHLDAMERMFKQHRTVDQAFRTLFDQLDDRQKAVASQLTASFHGWGGHHM